MGLWKNLLHGRHGSQPAKADRPTLITNPELSVRYHGGVARSDTTSYVSIAANSDDESGGETDNTYASIKSWALSDQVQPPDSVHDSSSGIASDVASYNYPPATMTTFKGESSSSQDSGTKSVTWARLPGEAKTSNNYVQMHMRQSRSCYKNSVYDPRIIESMESVMSSMKQVELKDTSRLLSSTSTKGKYVRPAPFELLTDDIMLRILLNLPTDHVCRVRRVCKRWYRLIWEYPLLWTSIVINNETINIDKALKYLTRRLSYNTPKVCVILERIILNGCEQLTDKGLHTIARRCPELRYLELQGCSNITNVALFELVSNCVNLEHLDVTGCALVTCISLTDGMSSPQMARHQHQIYLRYLDMTDCYALEDQGLGIITSHCTHLQFLYLRRCVHISDEGIQHIARNCPYLREFSVSDCRRVTDLGMRELSKLGENLRYLSVAKCDRVSDVGVCYIAKHCLKLRYLNVRGCEAVSDDAVAFLAANCPRLRSLDIGKCDISDDGLQVLAEKCPQLRKLSLKSCDLITDQGIVMIAYQCRGLQQLNIQDCHLSVQAYRTVKKYCRRCIIEHTNPSFC
ncbi:F-box/LRR-repeat protein 7-like isoform X1 [Haliotis rubra]|uniref:F-box/LRR-repeat protein 7-like isoform X1 n=1 Tax=Haliotis rubra TaxID=36100 RepID=UPI001EE4FB23|nr:F-box/LRR-repeat protein 7-like isoform X1 [Haliotis rubra]